jgi:26S proteasome regulatory subunit N1
LLDSVTSAVGLGKEEPVVSDKSLFADILSVLAMTYSDSGKRETLTYRLSGGSEEDPGLWGHEYVR